MKKREIYQLKFYLRYVRGGSKILAFLACSVDRKLVEIFGHSCFENGDHVEDFYQ